MRKSSCSNIHTLQNLLYLVVLIGATYVTSGCANLIGGIMTTGQAIGEQNEVEARKKTKMTQLQIRKMQTRTFDESNKNKILSVALAVLQDDGFTVENANTDLGLLSAKKSLHEQDVDSAGMAFLKGFFGGGSTSEHTFSHLESTVTVTPFGEQTRVRVSARVAETSTRGAPNYTIITETEFYTGFFSKLEKGLFIQREEL